MFNPVSPRNDRIRTTTCAPRAGHTPWNQERAGPPGAAFGDGAAGPERGER